MTEKKELLKQIDDLLARLNIAAYIKQVRKLVDKLEQGSAPKDVPGQMEFGFTRHKPEPHKHLQDVMNEVKKELDKADAVRCVNKKVTDAQAMQRQRIGMLAEQCAADHTRNRGSVFYGPYSMLKPPQNRSGFWDYVAGFEEGYKHGQKDASDLFSAVEAAKATKGTEPCSPAR